MLLQNEILTVLESWKSVHPQFDIGEDLEDKHRMTWEAQSSFALSEGSSSSFQPREITHHDTRN